MKKIGLIAGAGTLPLEFVLSVKEQGKETVVYAIKGFASSEIEKISDKTHWLDLGQYAKLVFLLITEKVKELALLGKVKKEAVYENMYDKERQQFFGKVKNKKDYTLLSEFTKWLARVGVKVIDPTEYLQHIIAQKGVLTDEKPCSSIKEDIDYGFETAKTIAGMDIGQTVIVKDKSIVAVEGMEGTDNTILRGADFAGEGCVMVKVSRPNQDMRWDIPTVGVDTVDLLISKKYKALAIESGKMFLLDKEKMVKKANSSGLSIEVL